MKIRQMPRQELDIPSVIKDKGSVILYTYFRSSVKGQLAKGYIHSIPGGETKTNHKSSIL